MKDDLQLKTTFIRRRPSLEDDLHWKTTFIGRHPSENLACCLFCFATFFFDKAVALVHRLWIRLLQKIFFWGLQSPKQFSALLLRLYLGTKNFQRNSCAVMQTCKIRLLQKTFFLGLLRGLQISFELFGKGFSLPYFFQLSSCIVAQTWEIRLLRSLQSSCQLFCWGLFYHIFFNKAVALLCRLGKSDCFRKYFSRAVAQSPKQCVAS